MLDSDGAWIADSKQKKRTLVIGFLEYGTDEIRRLLDTLGLDVQDVLLCGQRKIEASTFITAGKLEEAKERLQELKLQHVVVDETLSPNQLRNIENALEVPVLDRPGVIIEIFSQHARTQEARTQVDLARLEYVLPRLAHLWSHFERQRGGGSANRGMGEKQLEVDRRLVKTRIAKLKLKLKEIEKNRKIRRKMRENLLKVALVGYTNAGKSTLLNALTKSEVLAENKLFATLDASIRLLSPDAHPPIVAVDTVGFVSRLPPALVASFRSTLEEVLDADLILHVVDASSPSARDEMAVTEEVLKELGVDKKDRWVVLNKIDLTKSHPNELRTLSPKSIRVSALNSEHVQDLRKRVIEHFAKSLELIDFLVPYSDSRSQALIHGYTHVVEKKHLEKGTFFRVRMNPVVGAQLGLDTYRLGKPRNK